MNLPIEKYRDKVVLGESLFTLDAKKQILYEYESPSNRLAFDKMDTNVEGYSFIFNTSTHQIRAREGAFVKNDRSIYLPYEVASLKWRNTPKKKDEFNRISYRNSHGYSLPGDCFENRMRGILPFVRFREDQYAIHLRQDRLVYSQAFGHMDESKVINFKELIQLKTKGGEGYKGFFMEHPHSLVKTPVEKKEDLIGLMEFLIPEYRLIDPVGLAIIEGKPVHHYLNAFPLQSAFALLSFTVSEAEKQKLISQPPTQAKQVRQNYKDKITIKRVTRKRE